MYQSISFSLSMSMSVMYYMSQAPKKYRDASKSKLFNAHDLLGYVKSPLSPNCALAPDCSEAPITELLILKTQAKSNLPEKASFLGNFTSLTWAGLHAVGNCCLEKNICYCQTASLQS